MYVNIILVVTGQDYYFLTISDAPHDYTALTVANENGVCVCVERGEVWMGMCVKLKRGMSLMDCCHVSKSFFFTFTI